ncbi:hypothetical protein E5288_WYG005159 [Bos mutus]|uniref:Uncharacterized protein n=1 Tax=Bos mutus TaxID=72004 RepID=A0A6B0S090_9CETA|nr:hypothetical protein [Bos mutus]
MLGQPWTLVPLHTLWNLQQQPLPVAVGTGTVKHGSEAAVFLCDEQYKIYWNHHVLFKRLISINSLAPPCLRHSGKVMSAAQEPETEEEAQSGPPATRKRGPCQTGKKETGEDSGEPGTAGLGLRVTLAVLGGPWTPHLGRQSALLHAGQDCVQERESVARQKLRLGRGLRKPVSSQGEDSLIPTRVFPALVSVDYLHPYFIHRFVYFKHVAFLIPVYILVQSKLKNNKHRLHTNSPDLDTSAPAGKRFRSPWKPGSSLEVAFKGTSASMQPLFSDHRA